MTKKYIVKNCELICNGECPNSKTGFCEDCTDCLIKQVVEKCKNIECPCELDGVDCLECGESRRKTFANEILQLFNIEECEQ